MTFRGPRASVVWLRACAAFAMAFCWTVLTGCGGPSPHERLQAADRASLETMVRADAASSGVAGRKVLLVHSYHKEYEWVAQITRGVKRSLEKSRVDLEVFYMDTKRKSGDAWKRKAGDAAANVVEEWRPEVVIAVDDNAQEYFAKRYVGQDWPQIVFCGVNAEPDSYGYPAGNVTGVLERPYYVATLAMLGEILPEARRIAAISDNSPTSAGALQYMKKQETPFEVVCWETPDTFEQWKDQVLRVQDSADAIATYMYHTVGQADSEENTTPRDVMAWTVEHSKIPVLGFFVFTVDDGGLCGMVESGVEHGWEAGQIALEILRGKMAADFPVKTARHGQSMLNLQTAERLGIRIPERVLKTTDIVLGER